MIESVIGLMVECVPCNPSDECKWLFSYLNAGKDEDIDTIYGKV